MIFFLKANVYDRQLYQFKFYEICCVSYFFQDQDFVGVKTENGFVTFDDGHGPCTQ